MDGAKKRLTGKEVVVAVGVGLAIAGVAGLGLGAGLGAGIIALAASKRRPVRQVERDGEGRLLGFEALLRDVQRGGVAPQLRPELWLLLLGVHGPGASEDERHAEEARLHRHYVKLLLVCRELEAEAEAARRAAPPEPLSGSVAAFAEAHRVIVLDAVRTDFSAFAASPDQLQQEQQGASQRAGGGAGSSERCASPTVTMLPMAVVNGMDEYVFVEKPAGVAAEADTAASEQAAAAAAAGAAEQLGAAPATEKPAADAAAADCGTAVLWISRVAADALDHAVHVAPAAKRQMLRLVQLLSAYAVTDPECGYCQGMSDLASVFLQVFGEDDALAFACFERFMRGARRNFLHCGTGIKQQLAALADILARTDPSLYRALERLGSADCMFAYRMVLVKLRRELPPEHAMALLEILWARDLLTAPAGLSGGRTSSRGSLRPEGGSSDAAASGAAGQASASGSSSSGNAEEVPSQLPPWPESSSSSGNGGGSGSLGGTTSSIRPASRGASASAGPAAGTAGDAFLLWFIASVVRSQRWKILRECTGYDDVLRLFSTVKVDFWATLESAEKWHAQCGESLSGEEDNRWALFST